MKNIKNQLADYDSTKVDIYIAYLKQLQSDAKNTWIKSIGPEEFINVFKKVSSTGLSIDGDTVTLGYLKKVVIQYNYHAYKNKITLMYPDTIFDFGLVYRGDEYSFKKESGKVTYNHIISDPFGEDREIIGAYGVIKNSRGEFLETINMETIGKMKNSSKMKFIWDAWFDRMVLKSIIKRICSVHFKDLVVEIEEMDNETNEPDNAGISVEIQEEIENAENQKELSKIYAEHSGNVGNEKQLLKLLSERKNQLPKNAPTETKK